MKERKGFLRLEPINPPDGFAQSIVTTIRLREKRRAQVRSAWLSLLTALSSGAVGFSFMYVAKSLNASGSYEYISLMTDQTALMYWKEIAMSIVESLPLVSLAFFLSACGTFIWSATKTLRDIRLALLPA